MVRMNEIEFVYVLVGHHYLSRKIGLETFIKGLWPTSLRSSAPTHIVNPPKTLVLLHDSVLNARNKRHHDEIQTLLRQGVQLVFVTSMEDDVAYFPPAFIEQSQGVFHEDQVLHDPGTLLYFVRDLTSGLLGVKQDRQKRRLHALEYLLK